MKQFVVAAAGMAALFSSAFAADLPVKARPLFAPQFSWTGCYIGGNVGWTKNDSRETTTPNPTGLPALAIAQTTFTYDHDNSGVAGGVQYGCQQQFGSWVLGLDSDFDFTSLNDTIFASHPIQSSVGAYTETLSQKLNWFSTTRGRVGFAWDRWMLFATGGLASGRVHASYLLQPAGLTLRYEGSDSWTRFGWTVGAGVEYAVTDNWFVRGEYMYIDLGHHNFVSPGIGPLGGNPVFWNSDIDTRFHVMRIAASYRFTGAPSLFQWASNGFR